jgi:hypothetical protein
VAAVLDRVKVRVGNPTLFGRSPVYYDGVHVGDVVKIDARYRGSVLVADATERFVQHAGDAESAETAAELVVQAFLRNARSKR